MCRMLVSLGMIFNISLVSFGADLLKSDLEDKTLFSPKVRGYCGKSSKSHGAWGYFTNKGPMIITENVHSGSQAVKLVRGGDRFVGTRANINIGSEADMKFSVWVKRNGKAGFSMKLYGSKTRKKAIVSFYIQPNGQVCTGSLKDGKFKWRYLKMKFPENVWCEFTVLTVEGKDRLFTAKISNKDGKQLSLTDDIKPLYKGVIDSFEFRNAGGNEVFVDDICLESKSLKVKSKVIEKKGSKIIKSEAKALWPQLWKNKGRRINLKQYMGAIAYWQEKYPQYFKISSQTKTAIDLPLYALEITDNSVSNKNKSIFLITTLHAGAERNGAHAVIAYMQWLLSNDKDAEKIRKHNIVVFIPIANPDGFFPSETFNNAGKVDIYSGSRGNIYEPDSLELKERYKKIAPEIDFFRAVCDKYKPDMQIDIHGLAMHYFGQIQPAMCGSAGSNYALRPWSSKINNLMVKAGNRAGIGYSQTEEMAQRLFWGPTMGKDNELSCWYGRPYFYTAMYTSLKYHTMVSTMECSWNSSITEPLKAVMLEVSDAKADDLPVNRIKSNGAMSIDAYGENREERRASRCDLWKNVKQFAVGSSYNYTPNWRVFVVAYGKDGLNALTGQRKDSGRWGQIVWDDFFKNIVKVKYIDMPAIKKFFNGAPPARKIMYEKGDNKNPNSNTKLKNGFAMTLWIAQPDIELIELKLNGKAVIGKNLRQWTEDGFTFVEIGIPPEQAIKESLWIVTCAWKGRFDAKRVNDYGWLPDNKMQNWINNDFSKNKNFSAFKQAEKGAKGYINSLKK